RAASAGRAGAADLPVHAHLGRRLLERRGGVLARDPARGGGDLRPDADLRDRHERGGARDRARGCLPAREDAPVHGELRPRGRAALVLGVLPGEVRGRAVRPGPDREHRLGAAQPGAGPHVQHLQHDPVPERADLLRPAAPGSRPRAVPRKPRAVRDPRARPQGVDPVHRARGPLQGAGRSREALPEGGMRTPEHLIAVGASWGGLQALEIVLRGLPRELPAAIVVAQHRSPAADDSLLVELLANATPLRVREAADKDRLEAGTVYVAPPDYHLLVDRETLALSTDAPVMHARPSIDVLFESAAEAFRRACLGLVLTGASADGARGLARIVELGGRAVVQEPAD